MNEKNIKNNIIENNYNEILKEIFDTKNIHEIFQIIKNKKQTNIDKFHEIIYSKDFNDKVILNKLFNCLKIKLDKPNKQQQILQNTIYDYLITPNDEIFFNLDLKEFQDINIKQLYADIIKGKYKNLKNNGINKIKDIGLNLNNLMEIPIKQYKNIILCFKYLLKEDNSVEFKKYQALILNDKDFDNYVDKSNIDDIDYFLRQKKETKTLRYNYEELYLEIKNIFKTQELLSVNNKNTKEDVLLLFIQNDLNNLFKKYTIEEINSIIYTYDFLTETTNDGLFFSELLKYLTVTAINNDTKLNDNIKKFFTLSNIDYFTNLFNKEQQNELLINRLLNIETKTIRDFISLKTLQYSFQNNENLILDYCNKYLNYCEKKSINFLGLDFVESIKILKKETTFTEIKNILNDFPDMNSTNELDFIFSSLYINYLLKKNMNFEEYKKVLFYSKIGVTSNNKNDLINIHLFYNFKFVISKQILSYQNNIYFDYFVTEEIRKDLKKEVEKSLAISEKEYLNQILDKHIVSNKVKSKI